LGGSFDYDGKEKNPSDSELLEPFRNEYVKQFMAGNMNNKTFVEYIKDLLKV